MMFRYAGVAVFGAFLAFSAVGSALGQAAPAASTPAAGSTPAADAPGPAITTPPAPVTSGSPEFDAVLKRWDDLRDQLIQVQVDYKAAKVADRPPLAEKFNKLKAEGEKLRPELLKISETALKANPKSVAITTFLASYANGCYNNDDYEEALRITELLIAADYSNKRVYSLAGKAAYNLDDFDKAEKYLTIARDANALDGRADSYLQNIPAYKTLWKKEQDIRAAEAKLTGDQANPRVLLKTNEGDIVVELFENEAPQTVANFINLVEKGYYNGLTFHRVLHEYMAQGGDPKGDGTGGPGYEIPCECYKENHRLHFRGALSMAHAGKDTGGSQFFLTFLPTPHLDGKAVNPKNEGTPHTVFGRVVSGFDVLPKIQRRSPPSSMHSFGPKTPMPPADKIVEAKVLNKRNHPYEPTKVPAAAKVVQ
jgi:cyclophilin family peptidyl-prolyl cis-trans isomerase